MKQGMLGAQAVDLLTPLEARLVAVFGDKPRTMAQFHGPDGSPDDDSDPVVTPAEIASAPGQIGPGQTPIGRPIADVLAEIDERTSGAGPLAGDGALLRRCAEEIRRLTREQDHHSRRADILRAECGHELWSECGNCGHKSNGRLESCPKCGSNVDALAIMVGDDYEFEHRCQPTSSPALAPGDVSIPRAILERLAKAAASDPDAREARWAAERILQQATLAAEPARTDPLHARVLAEATQIDARLTEPAPDSIGPRGSSYDGAHAPARVLCPTCNREHFPTDCCQA